LRSGASIFQDGRLWDGIEEDPVATIWKWQLWIFEDFTATKSTPMELRRQSKWLYRIEKIGRGERI
jgi:hypothetical protein